MYSTAVDPQLDSCFPSSVHTFQVRYKLEASLTPQQSGLHCISSLRRITSGSMEELKHLPCQTLSAVSTCHFHT